MQRKVHFKFLQFLVVTYDIGNRRHLNGSGLFPLIKHFVETDMTKSPPIIIRECIFKNKNLCFASRALKDKSRTNQVNIRNNETVFSLSTHVDV